MEGSLLSGSAMDVGELVFELLFLKFCIFGFYFELPVVLKFCICGCGLATRTILALFKVCISAT